MQEKANELEQKCAELRKQVEFYKAIAKEAGQNRFREIERLNQQITKGRTTERMLKDSLERFSRLAENSPDMIYRMSIPDGEYQYVSPASEKITGYKPEDFYSSPLIINKVIHPDWQDYFTMEWQKILAGESPPIYEYQIIHKSGKIRHLHQRNVLVKDETGNPICIEGIVTDMTERHHILEMMIREKKTAQTYLDIAGVMLGTLDLNGNITLMNKKGHQILGYPEGELLGKNWFKTCLPEKIQPQIKDVFKRQMSGDFTPLEFYENALCSKTGEERIIAFHNTLLTNETEITGVLFSGEDITERQQIEKAIQESEEKYRAVVNHQQDILLLHRVVPDGYETLYEVNRAAVDFYGYSRTELLQLSIVDLVDPDVLKQHKEKGDRDKLCRDKNLFLESIHITKAGIKVPVEVSASIVNIKDDDYILSSIRDISARKQAEIEHQELELQLHQKKKMEAVGYMAGGIAHNFNNNLSIILGNLELTTLKLPESSELGDYLEQAKIAVFRSRDLVKQIITYSRKGSQDKTLMKLKPVIEETIGLLSVTLPSSVQILTSYASTCHPVFIYADGSQMQEVLINLCNNAIHAMKEKGKLTISLEPIQLQRKDIPLQYDVPPGSYVRMSIQDTGHGIPVGNLEKIFDPFFTTKEEHEGAGMGLATVQGIIAQHGGLVKVHSSPGLGTTFEVFLPIVTTTSTEEKSDPADSEISTGTEHILFIDDDVMLANLGEQLLTELGYQVTMMTDSQKALNVFTADPDLFDLVITDQTMPTLTGKELIHELKKIRPDLRTVLCTGFSSQVDEDEAKKLGIDVFLMKPLDLSELAQTIRQLLD